MAELECLLVYMWTVSVLDLVPDKERVLERAT